MKVLFILLISCILSFTSISFANETSNNQDQEKSQSQSEQKQGRENCASPSDPFCGW